MSGLEDKKAAVKDLNEKFSNANMVVLTDYRGLNVSEISELRGKLRESGCEMRVIKNTLTRLAVKETSFEELLPFLEGPNAAVFCAEEIVQPAKTLFDFARTHKNLEIRVGVLEGKVLKPEEVKTLSTLPPKEVLVAQVIGGIQAPLYGLVYVLQANITGLARVLEGIRKQKEAS
ncbi:MAG: 50S ribosomal protein L10 [Chitinophagales bacterium]